MVIASNIDHTLGDLNSCILYNQIQKQRVVVICSVAAGLPERIRCACRLNCVSNCNARKTTTWWRSRYIFVFDTPLRSKPSAVWVYNECLSLEYYTYITRWCTTAQCIRILKGRTLHIIMKLFIVALLCGLAGKKYMHIFILWFG